ncbi:MAG TPA: hypothetical protein VMF06_05590 [Candidatus Limnocylindria bacterium]|jgi:hypothetical protein|nr:hypothetical protein [Candidatus Limnocylindria bacterium]
MSIPSPENKTRHFFLVSSGVLLGLTGAIKLISTISPAKLLATPDAVFYLPRWELLAAAGIVEVAVAAYIFVGRQGMLKVQMIAWLAGILSIYRLGMLWVESPVPCSCLGNATDWFPFLAPYENPAMIGLLIYLFSGSLLCLIGNRWPRIQITIPLG